MWWGGEGAEAATEAVEGAPEMEDMKEQFDMQQNLIKQLKDMVKSHQTQLQEKEHQVQQLSTEQSSRLASLSQQVAALEASAPANQSTASVGGAEGRRERMQEIKRQLEEQRRQQQERAAEQREDLEAMVRALQARVENQEYRYDSCDSADSGSDGEPEYGSSPRKSMTLSDSVRSKEPAELYGVILAKDNRIYELSDKVSALEATIVDLKETLQEKESVISARTEAVSLVTKALTERGRGALESLDETRLQMKEMQEAFAVHEADWNVQREKLTRQLEQASERLETSEENAKKIEAAKFDLVIANANLQEKLVNLQASAKQESVRAAALESELSEVKRELADQQKMVFRVKSQKRQRQSQLETEAGQLTARITELQQLNEELRQQLGGGAEERELDRSQLQAECDSHQEALARLQEDAAQQQQQLQLAVEQARAQLADREQQLTELRQQVSELEVSADEKDALASKLRSEQSNLELQVTELTSALEQTRSDLEEAANNLENTQFSLEKTQMALEEALKGQEEAKRNEEIARTSLVQSGEKLEESNAQLESERFERATVAAELEEARSEIKILQSDVAESASSSERQSTVDAGSGSETQVTAEAASQSEAQLTSDTACQDERRLTAETGSQPELAPTSEAACQSEHTAPEPETPLLSSAPDSSDAPGPAFSGLQAQIDVLTTDLQTSRRLLEESDADRDRVSQDCERLRQSVAALETQLKQSEVFISELQYSSKQLQEEVENEKFDKEEVRSQLEARIAVLEAPDSAGDPKQDLKKLAKKLKARLKQELKSKASLEEKVSIMKQKTEELRANITELEAGWRNAPTSTDVEALHVELTELRCQVESETKAKLDAEQALSEALLARTELESRAAEAAQSASPQETVHTTHEVDGTADGAASTGGSDNKQKMKLMKAKLRKEIQNKVDLQKELADVKGELAESQKLLEESRASLAMETNRTQEVVAAMEADLSETREKLNVAEADLASIQTEKEALQSSLEQAAQAPVAEPRSARCQELLDQLSLHQQEHTSQGDGEELCALAERIQQEMGHSALPAVEQGEVLSSLSLTLAAALAELRHRQPARADPFELPPLRASDRDRSNSQSSIMSERSLGGESARSEPVAGADSEKDALLLKQQARLRQLTAAVRRRTEMRDEAVAKVRALEEESGELRTRLEQAEAEVAALQTERDAWVASVADTDAQIAARLDEYSVAVNAEKEKWNEEMMEKDSRIENLLEDISRKVVEVETLEKEVADKDEKVSKLVEEMLDNADDINDRQQQLLEKENMITSLTEEISTLKTSLQETTSQRDSLQSQLASVTSQQQTAPPAASASAADVEAEAAVGVAPTELPPGLGALEVVCGSAPVVGDAGLVSDVRTLMRQLRSLPASEAGALFSGALDVVSLPSSGSDGQQRDSSEDNWSVVDERHSPPPAATPAAGSKEAAAPKDASPPSETSEAVTVVSAAAPASAAWNWDDEWEDDGAPTPATEKPVGLSPSESEKPPADAEDPATEQAVSDGWGWGVEDEDSGAPMPATETPGGLSMSEPEKPPTEAEEPVTEQAINDGWGWGDEGAGVEAPPSGQWGWDEDAGWPSENQPPSEALQLGNAELVSEQVLAGEVIVPAAGASAELDEVRRQLLTTQREVADLRAEKERLQLQLDSQPSSLTLGQDGALELGTPTDRMEAGLSEPCVGRELVEDTERTEAVAEQEQAAADAEALQAVARLEAAVAARLAAEAESRSQTERAAQLEAELSARLETESAARAEAEAAYTRKTETASRLQTQLDALTEESARLRQELAAATAKSESAERHLEEHRVNANHQWSALNFENSSLKSDLASTESDLMELQTRYDTVEQERSEVVSRLEQHQRQLARLQEEVSALRVTQEAAERQRVQVDAQREAAEAARTAAVSLAERCLAELRTNADLVDLLQTEVGELRAAAAAAADSAAPPLPAEQPVSPRWSEHSFTELPQAGDHRQPPAAEERGLVAAAGKPETESPNDYDREGEEVASYFSRHEVAHYEGAQQQGQYYSQTIAPVQNSAAPGAETYFSPPAQQTAGPSDLAQETHGTAMYFNQEYQQPSTAAYFSSTEPQQAYQQEALPEGVTSPYSTAQPTVNQAHPGSGLSYQAPVYGQSDNPQAPAAPLEDTAPSAPPMTWDAADQSGAPGTAQTYPDRTQDSAPAPAVPMFSMFGAPQVSAGPQLGSDPFAAIAGPPLDHQPGQEPFSSVPPMPDSHPADQGSFASPPVSQPVYTADSAPHQFMTSEERPAPEGGAADGDLGHQLTVVCQERDRLQLALETAQLDAEQLRQRLAAAERDGEQLQSRLQQLEPAAGEQQRQLEAALCERDELQLRVSDLAPAAEQLRAALAERLEVETELEAARRQLEQLRHADDAKHQLNMQVLESETKVEQLELRLAELEPVAARLAQAEQERDHLQTQLTQTQQLQTDWQTQLVQAEEQRNSLQTQLTLMEQTRADWQAQLAQVSEEKTRLEQSLEETRAQLATAAAPDVARQAAAEEPVVQSVSNVFSSAAAPALFSAPAAEPSSTAKLFSASLFGSEPAAPSTDLLDSFGFIPAPAPTPAPAVEQAPSPVADASEQIHQLRVDNEKLRARVDELTPATERCRLLEAELEQRDAQLTHQVGVQQQLAAVQAENEAQKSQIDALKNIEQQLGPLQVENESQKLRLESLSATEQRLSSLQTEYEMLRLRFEELSDTEQRLLSLQSEHEAQKQRLDTLSAVEQQLVSLQAEHAARTAELESWAAAEQQWQAENARLTSALESTASVSERVAQLEADNQALRTSLQQREDRQGLGTEAEEKAPVTERDTLAATVQPGATSTDTSAAFTESDASAARLVEAEQARAALQAEKETVEGQLAEASAELQSVRAELEMVKAQLQQYVEYYNYYAAYYAQSQGQQYDQAQAQQAPDTNMAEQTYAASQSQQQTDTAGVRGGDVADAVTPQAEVQDWVGDTAASDPFLNSAAPTSSPEAVSSAGGGLATVSLFSPEKPIQQVQSAASFFAPAGSADNQPAFDLTAPSAAAGSGAVADTVVSAAQSVLPSAVLSFFGGGSSEPAAAAPAPDRTLAELQQENQRLRGRVSELERKVTSSQLPAPDPLVALTSSPFLEESGSPPNRAEWGWEEFSPSLEAASVPLHAPADSEAAGEVARLKADLDVERERARALELEKASLTQRISHLEAEAAALRERAAAVDSQMSDDLQRERQHALSAEASEVSALTALSDQAAADAEQLTQMAAELTAEREKVRQTAGQLASTNCRLTARREEVARLQEETAALKAQVAELTTELEKERSRMSAGVDGSGAFSLMCTSPPQLPVDGTQVSDLQEQVGQLTAELQMERERSAAVEQQRAASDSQLLNLQQQVSVLSGELQTERERSWTQQQPAVGDAQLTSLQEQVSLLSSELQNERERSQAAAQQAAAAAGGDEAAQLSAQLAEELATVAELTSELEAERADVSRLEGEVQMLRDLLADAQSQLSAARAAPAAAADTALADQAAFYRQKVTELETALAAGKEELQQAKVKNGRLLQKLKLREKKGASPSLGVDALDTAMMEELQGQVTEATRRAEEAETRARELQSEKTRLADQVSTYQDGQERLVEAKEQLEVEVHTLRVENDRLRHQLRDMEWRMAELEEAAEGRAPAATQQQAAEPTAAAVEGAGAEGLVEAVTVAQVGSELTSAPSQEAANLAQLLREKADLELKLTELELRNEELLEMYDNSRMASSQAADSQLQRSVEQLQLSLDAAATENAQLTERLTAYEAHWAAQQAAASAYTAVPPEQPGPAPGGADAGAGSVPPLSQLALSAAQAQTPAQQTPAASDQPTAEDVSSRLRSREVIIHSMADEISSLRASNAALLAESAHWRTLAEEGEDGDVLDGLNENLRLLNEALQGREARCRELTSEVAQLLEERDLLQLRLSSSLRLNQAHRPDPAQDAAPAQTEDVQQLKNKLAELKQLNYLLDIQLQGEVAERRRLQMSLQSELPRHQMSPNTSNLVSSSTKEM